jgi:hypothetical protein
MECRLEILAPLRPLNEGVSAEDGAVILFRQASMIALKFLPRITFILPAKLQIYSRNLFGSVVEYSSKQGNTSRGSFTDIGPPGNAGHGLVNCCSSIPAQSQSFRQMVKSLLYLKRARRLHRTVSRNIKVDLYL